MPSESVDLIVTDPPYGIEYKSNGRHGKDYDEKVRDISWDSEFDFRPYWAELYRVLKNNSHAYVFGTWKNYELMTRLEGFKQVLIWDKKTPKMGDLFSWGGGYELIFFFMKGRRAVQQRKNGVISFLFQGHFSDTLHPTQKPEGLARVLIENSSLPNETVLDAFMGSGTFGVDAILAGRKFIGIEKNEDYFRIASKRIKDATQIGRLQFFT